MTPSEKSFVLWYLDIIQEEWSNAIQADDEFGAHWLNEREAVEFSTKYPNITKFGEFLQDLEKTINEN